MRPTRWILCTAIVGCSFLGSASAQEAVRWQVNLEAAKRLALQTNRLVLIHFWADWCQACKQMEQEVFVRPDVASAMDARFVPVRIHVDHFPQTARQYGVSVLPSDVILTSQGQQVVAKFEGRTSPSDYLARLGQAASTATQLAVASQSRAPSGPAPPSAQASRGPQLGGPSGPRPNYDRPTGPPRYSDARYAEHFSRKPQVPPGNPPLALAGYCPVRLSESERWVPGDPRWGLVHEGRTYLFAGPVERDRFDAEPGRYAPALSGNDLVLLVEEGRTVPGRREHGAWFERQREGRFEKRVYLFSSEATLARFEADPYRYISRLTQSTQSVETAALGVPPRQRFEPDNRAPGNVPVEATRAPFQRSRY